jgi:GNAT superfamily N-acetyltransferase
MALPRNGFEPQFEEILGGAPALGKAALLPWDTEIFGFPVALFCVGDEAPDNAIRKDVAPHFSSWMMHHEVSVCGCVLPAGNVFWKSFLPTLGFRFVDFAIEARLRDLSSATLPPVRAALRNPQPGDQGAIETLAARSFAHGRYFADPLFPRDLAQRRYKRWVANALAEANGPDRVYVLGEPGSVNGFFHVAVQGHEADLRLAAIAPEFQSTGMGFDLYISVLHELKNLGVRRIVTSISAANTAVMNVYSVLGFRFAHPEIIYHWHAPAFANGILEGCLEF